MMDKNKIILIEADTALSVVMTEELGRVGFKVWVATDGEAGLSLTRKKKPDLVLLDIALPKKSGEIVLRELKADPATKDIPVVILTSVGMDESIKKALQLGAEDYFVKSQHAVGELIEMVQNLFMPDGVVK